ncbi:MAG: SOS response-associated peptidase [Stellaceae bacterium]|jgi:putative SOS response-associated peptidase YedK
MCGRFKLSTPAEELRREFGFVEHPNLAPRYNIAPTQEVPVLRQRRAPKGERTLQNLRWGLIPSWAKDAKFASSLINARAETLAEKPAFAAAFRKRRCLVLADGFYAWTGEDEAKQPYLIARRDGGAFAFAGLWERWTPKADGKESPYVDSFTIVTTEANDFLRPLHPRMPVILPETHRAIWLDPDASPESLKPLLAPTAEDLLRYYPVSKRVNSARIDEPDLAAPAGPETAA